jgi:gamma-glutamyltranspeptidase
MKHHARLSLLLALGLLLAACGEQRQAMVSTANEHASAAAAEILEAGGSAADAAIAAQLVLGLVEPQSSGHRRGRLRAALGRRRRALTAWDGRETAPVAAPADLFSGIDSAATFHAAATGGRAVGVPGIVSLLWEMHRSHGDLEWEELFGPALRLAEEGFAVSPRLHGAIAEAEGLSDDAMARELYFRNGQPLAVGDVLKNPAYASTLRRIEMMGPVAFYDGETAEEIVTAVAGHADNPGLMTRDDLRRFHAQQRPPVCLDYRGYEVCGMPPPTSGGLTTLMILGHLEPYRMGAWRPNSPTALHLIAQASRLAFADRNAYMADPDYVAVPSEGLIDPRYLKGARARHSPGPRHGRGGTGHAAGRLRVAGRGRCAGIGHQPSRHRRRERQCREHDDLGRAQLRGAHHGGRLRAQQPADRLRVCARARRRTGGEPGGGGQAAALVDGPDHGVQRRRRPVRRSGLARRPAHHRFRRPDDRRAHRLGPDDARRNRFAAGRQHERADPARSRHGAGIRRCGTRGHGPRGEVLPMVSGLHGIRITDDGLDGGADGRREGVVVAIEP